ncbi:hypothetical protein ACF09G_36345 [Streptomyces albogriseolus]|uniref:hypothetical protein n=1 Tax=Streptomyces albogriseolus TaxID=1887 RepID=UPI0019C7AB64|nr:hypothetical protein [Streptomyces sp.]
MPHVFPLSAPEPAPDGRARLGTTARIAGVVAFPVIGGVLAVTGLPVGDVLAVVSGCGAIGAVAVAFAGGRLTGPRARGRLAGVLAASAARTAQEPQP